MKNSLLTILCALFFIACARMGEPAGMTPDYSDATVPCNIAPLNFSYEGGAGSTTFSAGDVSFTFKGGEIVWDEDDWRTLLQAAAGSDIAVSGRGGEWTVHVSRDTVDRYLTYRLIEPGYEVWDRVEIRERDLTGWDERVLCHHSNTGNSCMNCHIHKGRSSMFYLRGPKGGAILSEDGAQPRKLSLRNSSMISGTVYGDLHPQGRWGVFSTNIIIPGFHTLGARRLEVYDTASDLAIADFEGNRMLTPPSLARADRLETFPCFSADGHAIYWCSAPAADLPGGLDSLRYALVSASFNPENGAVGTEYVIWDAPAEGKSVCHPRCSPDGRFLMLTVADYGTFPIWHKECDLALIDLETGGFVDMDAANAEGSDTYHSWSSNSRWFVFASKRADGVFGRPYLCHIDGQGRVGKPFVVPQKDPRHYEKTLKSYNIPDLGVIPAPYDSASTARLRDNVEAETFN